MYASQAPWRELFDALQEYEGADAHTDVLGPWAVENLEEFHWLAEFSRRADSNWRTADDEDLCRLYAIFRVASLLLLRFQSGRADGTDWPGPAIAVDGYRRFFETMGLHVPSTVGFHPFFHEIVGVRESPDAQEPVSIVEEAWPPLMLGDLMFCRAGVVVAGGRDHVVKAIAERSTLYWTFRRKDRPCNDLSHGWGGNSQWRTALRRDYRSAQGFHYNVDAKQPLDASVDTTQSGIAAKAMIELVRHRGLVRTVADDSDLWPYRYSYTE